MRPGHLAAPCQYVFVLLHSWVVLALGAEGGLENHVGVDMVPLTACDALGAPPPLIDRLRQKVDGLGEAPYVLFVGLAFLWRSPLTIDIDDGRMLVGDGDPETEQA